MGNWVAVKRIDLDRNRSRRRATGTTRRGDNHLDKPMIHEVASPEDGDVWVVSRISEVNPKRILGTNLNDAVCSGTAATCNTARASVQDCVAASSASRASRPRATGSGRYGRIRSHTADDGRVSRATGTRREGSRRTGSSRVRAVRSTADARSESERATVGASRSTRRRRTGARGEDEVRASGTSSSGLGRRGDVRIERPVNQDARHRHKTVAFELCRRVISGVSDVYAGRVRARDIHVAIGTSTTTTVGTTGTGVDGNVTTVTTSRSGRASTTGTTKHPGRRPGSPGDGRVSGSTGSGR